MILAEQGWGCCANKELYSTLRSPLAPFVWWETTVLPTLSGGRWTLLDLHRQKKKSLIHNNLHLQHQETRQKTTSQKLSVSSSPKACSCTYQVCSKEAGAFWRMSSYGQLYGFLPCLWIMQPPSLLKLSSTCVYKNTVLISMQASK